MPKRSPARTKYVYAFGKRTEGRAEMRELLGGKGANLAEMANIGLPVPAGFTLSTAVCNYFYDHDERYPDGLEQTVRESIRNVESQLDKRFGDARNPLLVSVRSGARESMPGMMDTILNLGLNDKTVEGLARRTGNRRFAYDCYRRFIHMYGDVVMGVHAESDAHEEPFSALLEKAKTRARVKQDTDLDDTALVALVASYKDLIKKRTGKQFPQDVFGQLWGAIGAVFGSWKNERAVLYLSLIHI